MSVVVYGVIVNASNVNGITCVRLKTFGYVPHDESGKLTPVEQSTLVYLLCVRRVADIVQSTGATSFDSSIDGFPRMTHSFMPNWRARTNSIK